jgi:hypothetical protein
MVRSRVLAGEADDPQRDMQVRGFEGEEMTDDLRRIEEKLDEVIDALPLLRALGEVLVQRKTVNERMGLNKNTISQNKNIKKFEEAGHRKTYIEIGDIAVVKQRKRGQK